MIYKCPHGKYSALDCKECMASAVSEKDALLEAAKEALCWLDPDCKYDGVKETEDMSDKEKMILGLYKAIAQAGGRS